MFAIRIDTGCQRCLARTPWLKILAFRVGVGVDAESRGDILYWSDWIFNFPASHEECREGNEEDQFVHGVRSVVRESIVNHIETNEVVFLVSHAGNFETDCSTDFDHGVGTSGPF